MIRALAALLLVVAATAGATSIDARVMATGGNELGRPIGDVMRGNPAYRAVPRFEPLGERSIPLPIGLLKADIPTFDPNDEDFDIVEIVEFFQNFPWTLQFGRPAPLDGNLGIGIARDRVTIDLGDAREIVPEDEFRSGGHHTLFEFGTSIDLGPRYGVVHVAPLQIFTTNEITLRPDADLVGVLRRGEPIVGGRRYRLTGSGTAQQGLAASVGYSREIPLPGGTDVSGDDWLQSYWDGERTRPRLWAGLAVRRYMGATYFGLDGDLDLIGRDPLLGEGGDFTVDLDSEAYRSAPRGLTGWGGGWALDLGTVLRWRDTEVGVGITDLFADLTWSKTTVDRYAYDPVTDELEDRRVATSRTTHTDIPRTWRLDVVHRFDRLRTVGVSMVDGPGGRVFHAGSENWVRPWLALRAGSELDSREMLHFGAGIGLRRGTVGFDLAARTHARNLRGDRVLEIGLSLVLNARPRGGGP